MADTHYRPSMYGARTTFNPATYARESVDVDYPPAADYADDYAGNMTVMVPKVVYDQEEESYEVPRLVIETATRLVPRTRRVMEERTRMVREPVTVLEEREQVVQVPRIEMEEVTIKVPKTVFDRYVLALLFAQPIEGRPHRLTCAPSPAPCDVGEQQDADGEGADHGDA